MSAMPRLSVLLFVVCVAVPAIFAAPEQKVATKAGAAQPSVVRVNVTNQPPDFIRPWARRPPFSRRALGAVLNNNRVLVTGELVANATYVELEKGGSGEKTAASVETVDYEANLAIIKPVDEKFLAGFKPLSLENGKVGDRVAVWQLEPNGNLLATDALLTTVEVSRYPIDDIGLLVYRLTSSLQYREGSFTLPLIKENKLIGILMRYDSRSQNVDAIPEPVIRHFLKAAAADEYVGFPRLGIEFSQTRDPQLRRFAGIESEPGGVYITKVNRGSPADAAGLRVGDVLLAVGGTPIDQDGNYPDPVHGKISLMHLLSTVHYAGETLQLKIFREGKLVTLPVELRHRRVTEATIEPYVIDRQPKFYILGGLVFQELSRQYLKDWGPEWYKKAPERFLYYDRYQNDLFDEPGRKIVILSQVLPSAVTIGYEPLSYNVIAKINDVPIHKLEDVEGAAAKPVDGFHKIEFSDGPPAIYLDAAKVEEQREALMRNYSLPVLKNLD
jgi:S1-C subfamily serine protease